MDFRMQALEEYPEIMRPGACFDTALKLEENSKPEANVADWKSICHASGTRNAGVGCQNIKRNKPLYTCTYKSLSSFWQASRKVTSA
jgi:hypothetical protein